MKINNKIIVEDLIVMSEEFLPKYGVQYVKTLLSLSNLPDDISVIGFNDEPYSSYFVPTLSSV